jgi:hypothetical protein
MLRVIYIYIVKIHESLRPCVEERGLILEAGYGFYNNVLIFCFFNGDKAPVTETLCIYK